MCALEQTFVQAINDGQIEGVLIEGRTKDGGQYSKALGSRTCLDGSQKPLHSSDILFLASATKFLTTIAALHCCEKGQLSLDADLTSRLPGLRRLGVLIDWDENTNSHTFEPLRKPLTLRQMLTHSSGLLYDFTVPKMQRWRAANPLPQGAVGVEARYTTPLGFQPGQEWLYGSGVEWAGLLVEQATGLKLDEYLRRNIFEPVGIPATDISFFPVTEGLGSRMPDLNPNDPNGLGLSSAMGINMHDDVPGECYGGGCGYTSAVAYVAVLQSLLANDGKILSRESVAEMIKPQLENEAKASLAEKLRGEWSPYFNMGTTGLSQDFGLGGLLVTEEGDGSGLGKGTITWGGGISTAWFIDPENDICGFLSLQLGIPGNATKGLELKALFRKHLKEVLRNDP